MMSNQCIVLAQVSKQHKGSKGCGSGCECGCDCLPFVGFV